MSEQTEITTTAEVATARVTYVVQKLTEFYGEDGKTAVATAWLDIATVNVPPRTKRRVAIRQAPDEAGIKPDKVTERLRALDADSAEILDFEPYQPQSEWRVA